MCLDYCRCFVLWFVVVGIVRVGFLAWFSVVLGRCLVVAQVRLIAGFTSLLCGAIVENVGFRVVMLVCVCVLVWLLLLSLLLVCVMFV